MKERVLFENYVTDNGMSTRLLEGDKVFYKKRNPKDGEVVVASIEGEKVIVRRYNKLDKGFLLIPDNPQYKELIFNEDDLENGNCEIFGVVKRIEAYF